MTRLVAPHIGENLFQQRFLGEIAHLAEAVEREPLDHDLHADELLGPVAGLQCAVEQTFEVRRDRPDHIELLDVAREYLDMSRLIDGLSRRVELGVGMRHRIHELRGDHQGALLAMQKVAQAKARHPFLQLPYGLGTERAPVRGLFNRKADSERRSSQRGVIERPLPVELAFSDPLRLQCFDVQAAQLLDLGTVVPLIDHLHRGRQATLLRGGDNVELTHLDVGFSRCNGAARS